jgi:hypothetical protein
MSHPLAFSLQPFLQNAPDHDWQITGQMSRSDHQLNVHYHLMGNLAGVIIPNLTDPGDRSAKGYDPSPVIDTRPPNRRKFALWEATCFEFFLGIQGDPAYWEFNLSPIGDWNIYHFDSYRQGLREELAFTALPFQVHHSATALSLELSCDLSPMVRPEQPLEIAVTTVVAHSDGTFSYWALSHCAPEADFHQRSSFTLTL